MMSKGRRTPSQDTDRSGTPELPPPSPAVPPPPFEWAQHSERLGPLLRQNSLPFVVAVDRRCLPSMEGVNFDFTQPLLLHTRRTVRKVVASNILHVQNGEATQAREVGDRLLIPEDYKGWFAVLGSPEAAQADRVVPHFRQVAKLALSKCQSFLIGGNEPVSAVQMTPAGSGGDLSPKPRLLYPGDVLRMGTLYSAETTIKVKSGRFGGKKTVKKEEKFLMCTDEQDREVYLPVEKSGMFYVLTIEGQVTPKIPILRMPDICSRFRFPCVVKLLYGRVPPTPCSFTGTLLLQDSHMEASVIGCTMLNLRNILLDIPIDSDLRFYMAHATTDLLTSKAYKSALSLCQEKTPTYMRNMKVAYYMGTEDDVGSPQEGSGGASAEAEKDPVSSPASDVQVEEPSLGSLRGSIMSHRPSVVEEQALFVPPETTPQTTPLVSNRKSSKKTQSFSTSPSCGSVISADALARRGSSGSPTILRRDKTFELPEPREVLPLRKRTESAPCLINPELRPLPPVKENGEEISPNHYMTMNDSEQTASNRDSVSERKKPAPPPKPKTPAPRPCNSASDLYHQVWDGEQQRLIVENAEDSEAPSRPKRPEHLLDAPCATGSLLSTPPVAHQMSSIAFADNYLTFPVFKAGSSPGSAAHTPLLEQPYEIMHPNRDKLDSEGQPYEVMTSPKDRQSPTATSSKDGQSTAGTSPKGRQSAAGAFPKDGQSTRGTAPKDRVSPLQRTQDQDPYEVMSSPKVRQNSGLTSEVVNSEKSAVQQPNPAPRKFSKPLPPLPKQISPSNSQESLPAKTKPVPVPQDRNPGSFEIGSPPTPERPASESSSTTRSSSPTDRKQSSQETDTYSIGRGVLARGTSYTYYEGYDPAKDMKNKPTEPNNEFLNTSSFDSSEDTVMVSSEFEDATYENVTNLQQLKSPESTLRSDGYQEMEETGIGMIEFVNPEAIFGYVSPPNNEPKSVDLESPNSQRRLGAASSEISDARPTFQTYPNLNDRPLPAPPKPCRASDLPVVHGYLHACNNLNQGLRDLRQSDGSLYSDTASRASSYEDDLPLGATFANYRPPRAPLSDSGCPLESVVDRADEATSEVSAMSVSDLSDALKNCGLKQETLDLLKEEKVNGRLLMSLEENELREALPRVGILDFRRICMFVNGWRPQPL